MLNPSAYKLQSSKQGLLCPGICLFKTWKLISIQRRYTGRLSFAVIWSTCHVEFNNLKKKIYVNNKLSLIHTCKATLFDMPKLSKTEHSHSNIFWLYLNAMQRALRALHNCSPWTKLKAVLWSVTKDFTVDGFAPVVEIDSTYNIVVIVTKVLNNSPGHVKHFAILAFTNVALQIAVFVVWSNHNIAQILLNLFTLSYNESLK